MIWTSAGSPATAPSSHVRHARAGAERDHGYRCHVLAGHLDGRAEAERVGSRDRDARVVGTPYPRDDVPEVEADHELGAHRHPAVEPLDDADDVRRFAARRHEVDRAYGSFL